MENKKAENHNSRKCLHEREIIRLQEKIEYTDEKIDDIKENISDIKDNLKSLSNGGFQEMLQEQNEDLVGVLTVIAQQKSDIEELEIKNKSEKAVLEKKIKLKIWHVIAIIAGSGLISFILNFLSNRM